MCVWNVTNGQCVEKAILPYRHTAICVSMIIPFRTSPDSTAPYDHLPSTRLKTLEGFFPGIFILSLEVSVIVCYFGIFLSPE